MTNPNDPTGQPDPTQPQQPVAQPPDPTQPQPQPPDPTQPQQPVPQPPDPTQPQQPPAPQPPVPEQPDPTQPQQPPPAQQPPVQQPVPTPDAGAVPPVPTEATKSPWPAVVATTVLAFLVGAAIGFVGGRVLGGDDDDGSTTTSADTSAPATTATTLPDPTLFAWADGSFEVAFPEGFHVGSSKFRAGLNQLRGRPSSDLNQSSFDAGGFTVGFDRRPGSSPEILLDAPASESCSTTGPNAPFSHGDYTGLVQVLTGCPNGFEQHQVAVVVPGGTHLVLVSTGAPGFEAAILRAIDTFRPGAQPTTQVAGYQPCRGDFDPSTNPEFPLGLKVQNFLDETVSSFGFLEADGQILEPQELVPAAETGTYFTRPGDVFRFNLPDGPVDLTVTSQDQEQCFVLTEDGFVPVTG